MDSRAIQVDDAWYYDVKTFSQLTNRTSSAVYSLIYLGNAIRKLKVVRMFGKPLIPVAELTEYPFTTPGPTGKNSIYHYKEVS